MLDGYRPTRSAAEAVLGGAVAVSAASRAKLVSALASGDTQGIINLSRRIAAEQAAQPSEEAGPTLLYKQATGAAALGGNVSQLSRFRGCLKEANPNALSLLLSMCFREL